MDYQTFITQFQEEMKKRSDSGDRIEVRRIPKINQASSECMTIFRPGEKVSPAIWLFPVYREFEKGRPMEALVSDILELVYGCRLPDGLCPDEPPGFPDAVKRLSCRLVNYEKNRALLDEIPHQRFLDLAVVYYYTLYDSPAGAAGILIRREHLKAWGIDAGRLDAAARANTRAARPRTFVPIRQALEKFVPEEEISALSGDDGDGPYILSNTSGQFGAVSLIFEDVLSDISCQLDGDFFVLPSSIHECIILPVPEGTDGQPRLLQRIVSEINEACVEEEDVLSSSVYRYRRGLHMLCMAAAAQE